jgi:hypothetical protein
VLENRRGHVILDSAMLHGAHANRHVGMVETIRQFPGLSGFPSG